MDTTLTFAHPPQQQYWCDGVGYHDTENDTLELHWLFSAIKDGTHMYFGVHFECVKWLNLYYVIITFQIKTFYNFLKWKCFYVWHKHQAWHKVMSAREAVSKSLLYLNPILGRALLDVMELCWKISKISFIDLSVIEKNDLHDFCNNQVKARFDYPC